MEIVAVRTERVDMVATERKAGSLADGTIRTKNGGEQGNNCVSV